MVEPILHFAPEASLVDDLRATYTDYKTAEVLDLAVYGLSHGERFFVCRKSLLAGSPSMRRRTMRP
jgi:hypothetical protein